MKETIKETIGGCIGCIGCLLYGLFLIGITFGIIYVITLFTKVSLEIIG